jgi:AcrR family transcriptional regulator
MEEKRQEIVDRVRDLYRQFGIRSVTMDDAVREIGISKKTLYQHFTDKSSLVNAVLECETKERLEEYHDAVNHSSNAIEQMLKFYDLQLKMIKEHNFSMIYDLKKYYPEIHAQFIERKRKGIFEGTLANLKRGKEEGLYRQELNNEIIARLNLMRIEGIIQSGIFSHEDIMAKGFFREMFTYHMYAIVNDKGRKILEKNIDKLK